MKMLILAFDVVLHSIINSQPFLIIRFFFFLFNSIVLKCSTRSIIDRLEKCSYFKKVHCIFNAHKQYVYRLVLDRTTIKQTSILFVVIDDRLNPPSLSTKTEIRTEPFKPLKKEPEPRTGSAKINGPKLGPNPEKMNFKSFQTQKF